ncbi:vWA domain-containing protein [Candidatus Cetobacterium colombiensis]|uniref:VWA domain-containing protein n=1 Tax=Candidatus Cetobacterium colombiensis TaxID=3073100 RepID=A0ABU4WBW0_9FUSO|nr:VWA domain-containing protein [Candidatus Cetobacterium colombiensis]MDX8337031.1 VWA domain-containing protein [Candidatus Cetobacterium colombiensis]
MKILFDFNNEVEKEAENPMARIPVVIIADTSSSMNGEKINTLNSEIENFYKEINNNSKNEILKYSLDLAVLGFKFDTQARETYPTVVNKFSVMESQKTPTFNAFGHTPLGSTVNTAIDMLEKRKEMYKLGGIQYYQPMLVIISDGDPTDSIESAAKRAIELSLKRKLSVYPVIIGDDGNLDNLQRFTPNKISKRIRTEDLPQVFKWLVSSAKKVSESSINFDINVNITKDWNDIING